MCDGLDVGGSITQFHKEPQIIFQKVWCTNDSKIQTIGVEVFQRFARTLFHVGGCHNLKIILERQAACLLYSLWILNNERKEMKPLLGGRSRTENDFIFIV